MDQLSESNNFLITHVVNPNHFYLCEKRLFDHELTESAEKYLLQYLRKLNEKKVHDYFFEPQINDCVAYYVAAKKKYIRCKVVDVKKQYDNRASYILFALDYGIPLVVTKLQDLIKIPENFMQLPSPIICCGLDVLPATTKFCLKKLREVTKYHFDWTIEGMECFWKLITDQMVVAFDHTQKDINYKNTHFGVLKIKTRQTGAIVDVNERLLNAEVALRPTNSADFLKKFKLTSTPSTEIWNDNFRSGGILKEAGTRNDILPNFKRLFHDLQHPKLSIHPSLLLVYEKVADWQKRNEGVEHEVPIDDAQFDAEDPEILFELNDFNNNKSDEEKKKAENLRDDKEKPELTHAEIRRRLEELAAMETASNNLKLRNKTKEMEIFPCGYQIQLVVQPNYTDNFENIEEEPRTRNAKAVPVKADDNDEEKW